MSDRKCTVAIVDYGLGNLFSVKQACLAAGLDAVITSSAEVIGEAHALVLPGVGAFGDAMAALHERGLVSVLRDTVRSGKPVMGICLGMQLLMTESFEFGRHEGLNLVSGSVNRFSQTHENGVPLKVPHIGWNRINPSPGGRSWGGTLLENVEEGTRMYFVHSFYVQPADPSIWLTRTRYGDHEFCSSLQYGNIFAAQFHPEKSGAAGLALYRSFKQSIKDRIL